MDAVQKNRQLSYCNLCVYRLSENAGPHLTHPIKLLGAEEPNNIFVLFLSCKHAEFLRCKGFNIIIVLL